MYLEEKYCEGEKVTMLVSKDGFETMTNVDVKGSKHRDGQLCYQLKRSDVDGTLYEDGMWIGS